MSPPNSQGSNDSKPLHLMSKMSPPNSQGSNESKPLHLMSKMSLPNSQGSNDIKPFHLMSKMSPPNSQGSNDIKTLHLMLKKCHYQHYNLDKFTLHKFWFTPIIALRIANNYGCHLLVTYLHHGAESLLSSQPVFSFRFVD
jgi:hypothetical protein